MITNDLLTEASIELSRIDRHFGWQWIDDDFPTDNLWVLLNEVSILLKNMTANDNPM